MGVVAAAAVCLALAWMAALSLYDVRYHRLPNALTLPGAVVVLIATAVSGHGGAACTGAIALTALYLVVHLVSPSGMGAGDVKLAIGLGALSGAFGLHAWLLAALGAPTFTAVAGLVARRQALPHGPSMCAATALAVLLSTARLPLG